MQCQMDPPVDLTWESKYYTRRQINSEQYKTMGCFQ